MNMRSVVYTRMRMRITEFACAGAESKRNSREFGRLKTEASRTASLPGWNHFYAISNSQDLLDLSSLTGESASYCIYAPVVQVGL